MGNLVTGTLSAPLYLPLTCRSTCMRAEDRRGWVRSNSYLVLTKKGTSSRSVMTCRGWGQPARYDLRVAEVDLWWEGRCGEAECRLGKK